MMRALTICLISILSCEISYASEIDWSGSYVGLSLAYSETKSKNEYVQTNPDATCNTNDFGFSYPCPSSQNNANYQHTYQSEQSKPLVGLKLGRNWTFDNFVLGLVADVNFTENSKMLDSTVIGTFGDKLTVNTKQRNLGDLRVIIGKPIDNFLPYLTAGVSWAKISNYVRQDSWYYAQYDGNLTFNNSRYKTGYVIGAGINYAVNDNWFLTAEYLHSDYGKVNLDHSAVTLLSIPYPNTNLVNEVTSNTIQVGLSCKF